MQILSLLLAGFATTAMASPMAMPDGFSTELVDGNALSARAASNCTTYCSNSAGCVCTVRPSDCTALYTVQPQDTCTKIANQFSNFTVTQLYKWNPDIGQTCQGLQAYVPICINTPWYKYTPPVQAAYGTVVRPAYTPVPIMPGIITTCGKFQLIAAGTTVAQLAKKNNFKASNFPVWNGNATAPWTDYWACVGNPPTATSS